MPRSLSVILKWPPSARLRSEHLRMTDKAACALERIFVFNATQPLGMARTSEGLLAPHKVLKYPGKPHLEINPDYRLDTTSPKM
jgi:hypothetical protein